MILCRDMVAHHEEGDERDDGGGARQHVAESFETVGGLHWKVPRILLLHQRRGVAPVPSQPSHTFGEHVRVHITVKNAKRDNR